MPTPHQVHRSGTRVLSSVMLGIGVVLVVLTIVRGGGPLARGILIGLLFIAFGAGRLYLARSSDG